MYAFYIWMTYQTPSAIMLGAYALLIASGLLAWALGIGKHLAPMGRAKFFLALASIVVLINLNESSFLWAGRAFATGWLSLLIPSYLLGLTLSGVLMSMIAQARSRDLCGSRKRTFVLFVPFGVFYMLFKAGAAQKAAEKNPKLAQGSSALVVMGLLIWGVGKGLGNSLVTAELRPLEGGETLQFDAMWVKKLGVEHYFRHVAMNLADSLPADAEPGVLLVRILASEDRLTYHYVVYNSELIADYFDGDILDDWIRPLDSFGPALHAGGSVESLFVDPEERPVFQHITRASDCTAA